MTLSLPQTGKHRPFQSRRTILAVGDVLCCGVDHMIGRACSSE